MAPTRRSARTKAESTEDRAEKVAKSPAVRGPGKARTAKKVESGSVKRSTRSRRAATAEAEEIEAVTIEEEEEKDMEEEDREEEEEGEEEDQTEKDENEQIPETDTTSAVRNHTKFRATPASTIASLASPPKAKATRGRVDKKKKATKVAAPVDEEIIHADEEATTLATPGPAIRRSTRGNRAASEVLADPITTEAPAVGRPKRGGKKVNSEVFAVAESSVVAAAAAAAASATPHWAKKRGRKVAQGVGEGDNEVLVETATQDIEDTGTAELEEPTKKGKKSAVSKKGKGKVEVAEENAEVETEATKEPSLVIEESAADTIDPIAKDYEVSNDKSKAISPSKAAKKTRKGATAVTKRATTASKGSTVKKAPATRRSTRGKKVEEVVSEEEEEEEDEEATQIDEVLGDTSMAIPQPTTEPVKKGAAKKGKGKGVIPKPPSEISETTQRDDSLMEEEATQPDEVQDVQTSQHQVSKPVVDSGVFDIESLPDTKEKPDVIFEESGIEGMGQQPAKSIDAKAPESQGEDIQMNTKGSVVVNGGAKKGRKPKGKGRGKRAVEILEETIISEVQNEVKKAITEPKIEGSEVNSVADVGPGNSVLEFGEEVAVEQSEVTVENIAEIEPQEADIAETKAVRPNKRSAPTRGKGRATAKKAKTQLQPEIDVDDADDADDGTKQEVGDIDKSVPSSLGTDPILGSKRSGVKKATPKKTPVKGARRGKSAAVVEHETTKVEAATGAKDAQKQEVVIDEQLRRESRVAEQNTEVAQGVDAIVEENRFGADNESGSNTLLEEGGAVHRGVVEKIMTGFSEGETGAHEEEEDIALPMSKPSIILSPTRFTSPDPDLDPIKSSVPSSPITLNVSHQQLHSSPLRNANQEPVLASPGPMTTPRASPTKKWTTPNTHTPSRLSQSGTPYGKNLEDSRDIGRSTSTPTRALNVDVHSSPVVMMPPPTPNVVSGDRRSPIKQTPTKESVAGDVILGKLGVNLGAGSVEHGEDVTSSPTKNPTPIKTEHLIHSSPAGRLSFVGDLSSPVVRKLENEIPLLSSPVASSPSKSSPIKKTKLDFLKNMKTSTLSSSPSRQSASDDEDNEDENVGDDTFAGRDSFHEIEDLVDRSDEGVDEGGVSMDSVHQEVYDQEEGAVKKATITSNMLPEPEENESEFDGSRFSNIDESRLFKLFDKAQKTEEEKEFAGVGAEEEENDGEQDEDIAECDLTFTVPNNLSNEDIPSSPWNESPLKLQEFTYEPTESIFPPRVDQEDEKRLEGEGEAEVFSPIMIYDNTFDQSAANWKEDDEAEEEGETDWDEEEEEGKGTSFHLDPESTGGRLQAFRASSPPNFWRAQEAKAITSPQPTTSPITPGHPGDETDFDKSYARGLGEDVNEEDEEAQEAPVDDTFEQSFARGVDMDKVGSEKEYEDINWLPDEEIGEDTQFEMSFIKGVEEEKEEIQKKKAEEERKERIAKGRKRFLEAEESVQAIKVSRGNGGRRHTFNPGEQRAKQGKGNGKRRLSGGAPPSRQFYLEKSRPDDVQFNWEEHIKRVAEERIAAVKIQKAYRAYKIAYAARCAETPVETSVETPIESPAEVPVIAKGSALHQAPIRPSMIPGRRLRYAQPSSSTSPPAIGGRVKRKAIDKLETGRIGKSNIPVSSSIPVSGKVLGEGKMISRHTSQNSLYSVGIKFQLIRKNHPRPTEAALEAAVQKAAQEAKERRRELMEQAGGWLHPGDEEVWVPTEDNGGGMKIRWDPQLVYICGEETEAPAEGVKNMPVRSVLKKPPPLTAHGNWVPVAGAAPLELSRELVEVSKVVYLGEDDPKDPVFGKGKRK